MNAGQRQAVLDNVRYLRQVRPIDPEEINAYVTGQPHPAAVAQVIREEAVGLGVIERPDGSFVPVSAEPLPVADEPVDALPDPHVRRLEDHLVEVLGPDWAEGSTGRSLRDRLRAVKGRYLANASVEYDQRTALAYAIYHLPQTYAATTYLVRSLIRAGHLGRSLRVLDVGAGVGGPALALCDLLPTDALLDYHAVEPSVAATVLDAMFADAGRNVHRTIHREPIEDHDPAGTYDLVLCANVLSELDAPAAVVADLLDSLAADGDLLAIAPADRRTAVDLRRTERRVEAGKGATVYGPTVRLWPGETPTSTCWSVDRKPALAVPAVQHRLDAAGAGDGEFVNVDVQFAYAVLRTDGETSLTLRPTVKRFAKMAAMESHVTNRVDLVAIKLSHDLTESVAGVTASEGGAARDRPAGANPVYLVGDGSEQVDHFAVLAEETTLNEDLEAAAYGAALGFENVLVLWNDDEAAYNLVVDGETVVDVAATS